MADAPYISAAVDKALAPYMDAMQEQMMKISEPLIDQTIIAMKPVVREEIRYHAPTVAAVVGAMLGVAYLVGTAVCAKRR